MDNVSVLVQHEALFKNSKFKY